MTLNEWKKIDKSMEDSLQDTVLYTLNLCSYFERCYTRLFTWFFNKHIFFRGRQIETCNISTPRALAKYTNNKSAQFHFGALGATIPLSQNLVQRHPLCERYLLRTNMMLVPQVFSYRFGRFRTDRGNSVQLCQVDDQYKILSRRKVADPVYAR